MIEEWFGSTCKLSSVIDGICFCILVMLRWATHPERLNAMGHMSKSELSRRRMSSTKSSADGTA